MHYLSFVSFPFGMFPCNLVEGFNLDSTTVSLESEILANCDRCPSCTAATQTHRVCFLRKWDNTCIWLQKHMCTHTDHGHTHTHKIVQIQTKVFNKTLVTDTKHSEAFSVIKRFSMWVPDERHCTIGGRSGDFWSLQKQEVCKFF